MHTPIAVILTFLPMVAAATVGSRVDPALKPIEPFDHPSYHSPPDVPGLPRVLLIGDSISIGYTLPVRERLSGIANVHRPAENCGPTQMGLAHADQWLAAGPWDVIHFNFGLHDLKYINEAGDVVTPDKGRQVTPLADYEKNLRKLVARLKETRAKLIFATTTPVPSGCGFRVEGDERRYNEAALRVMRETGVTVDDLWSAVRPRQAEIQTPHNVHFAPAGDQLLADTVAASIRAVISGGSKPGSP